MFIQKKRHVHFDYHSTKLPTYGEKDKQIQVALVNPNSFTCKSNAPEDVVEPVTECNNPLLSPDDTPLPLLPYDIEKLHDNIELLLDGLDRLGSEGDDEDRYYAQPEQTFNYIPEHIFDGATQF